MLGDQALSRFIQCKPSTVLDIGSGKGEQTRLMREAGIRVVRMDNKADADIFGTYPAARPAAQLPGIWCCHVLEHQRDPGRFLDALYEDLRMGGVLAITVPPIKRTLIGGHVTLWTENNLVYQLVLAGFDCSKARIGIYGYNISVIVEKGPRPDLSEVKMQNGDIEALSPYFPKQVRQGSSLGSVNW